MELLERMKRNGKRLGVLCVLLGQCHQQVLDAGAGGTRDFLDLDGAGIAAFRLLEAGRHRHAAADAQLRENGIRTLGSTIVGLEHHTPENIRDEIEYAVEHNTDFHQFMLYTPVPGTPLYYQMKEEGRMLDDVDLADIHGQ